MLGNDAAGERLDIGWIGHVELHRRHVLATGDGFLERVEPSAGHDDGVAPVVEPMGERLADARTATGDQDGVAVDLHAPTPRKVDGHSCIASVSPRKKAAGISILTGGRVSVGSVSAITGETMAGQRSGGR